MLDDVQKADTTRIQNNYSTREVKETLKWLSLSSFPSVSQDDSIHRSIQLRTLYSTFTFQALHNLHLGVKKTIKAIRYVAHLLRQGHCHDIVWNRETGIVHAKIPSCVAAAICSAPCNRNISYAIKMSNFQSKKDTQL